VKETQLPINPVIADKPKALRGLNQKVGDGLIRCNVGLQGQEIFGGEAAPNPPVLLMAKHDKPDPAPALASRLQGRPREGGQRMAEKANAAL
jgi:hypothetical protein